MPTTIAPVAILPSPDHHGDVVVTISFRPYSAEGMTEVTISGIIQPADHVETVALLDDAWERLCAYLNAYVDAWRAEEAEADQDDRQESPALPHAAGHRDMVCAR